MEENLKTLSDFYFTQEVYIKGLSEKYLPRKCFDNVFNVFINSVHNGDGLARKLEAVYGAVLSGTPFVDGRAVFHGWNELNGKVIDVTTVANGYTEDDVKTFLYLPWKSYSGESLLVALSRNENNYPAELMKRDKAFCAKIREMGYEIIG